MRVAWLGTCLGVCCQEQVRIHGFRVVHMLPSGLRPGERGCVCVRVARVCCNSHPTRRRNAPCPRDRIQGCEGQGCSCAPCCSTTRGRPRVGGSVVLAHRRRCAAAWRVPRTPDMWGACAKGRGAAANSSRQGTYPLEQTCVHHSPTHPCCTAPFPLVNNRGGAAIDSDRKTNSDAKRSYHDASQPNNDYTKVKYGSSAALSGSLFGNALRI